MNEHALTVVKLEILIEKDAGFEIEHFDGTTLQIALHRAHITATPTPEGADVSAFHLQQNAYNVYTYLDDTVAEDNLIPDGPAVNIPVDVGYYDTLNGPTGPHGLFSVDLVKAYDVSLKVFIMECTGIEKTWGFSWTWDPATGALTTTDKEP